MSVDQTTAERDLMRPLRLLYLKELLERQRILGDHLTQARVGRLGQEERDSIRQLAHKLNGTGATYGFPRISEAAALLEDLVAGPLPAPDDLVAHDLQNLLDACAAAHDQEPVSFSAAPPEPMVPEPNPVVPALGPALPLVLIVDDDADARAVLGALIEDSARVIMGTNADEAFALMQSEHPDLVLLDDNMPGATSGMKLLENIRQIDALASIPIIMITATDRPDAVMRGLTAGAVDYVIKPFDPALVGKKIKTRLKRLGTTILVVDDDRSVCDLLERKFSSAGYATRIAVNGQAAIDMMRASPPALVLLDRMLPGLDGMTVLQMMRDTPSLSDTPVIFLTARRKESDILDGFALGAADYVVKPFNPDEVVARCARLLGMRTGIAA